MSVPIYGLIGHALFRNQSRVGESSESDTRARGTVGGFRVPERNQWRSGCRRVSLLGARPDRPIPICPPLRRPAAGAC